MICDFMILLGYNIRKLQQYIFIVLVIASIAEVKADIRLPKIIGSDMVLQQGKENTIWGWAAKGEVITAYFSGQSYHTITDEEGRWEFKLPSMQYGGPYTLTIEGKNKMELKNIMIGEVWVCSGQSNMLFPLYQAQNAEEDIEQANFSNIRLFKVSPTLSLSPKDDLEKGRWSICTSAKARLFSAVGYYFGFKLHQNMDVPVGLIMSAWGGTVIETWMNREALVNNRDFERSLNLLIAVSARQQKSEQVETTVESNAKPLKPNDYPSLLYNAMIEPLIPFGIKGVIWYQGEANVERAQQYKRLFPELINGWRTKWQQGNFPFLFVSLAAYHEENNLPGPSKWAELREAQAEALLLPNTGMAIAIDVGDAKDIHPKNKKDIGYRLALNALKIAYNKPVIASGPVFTNMVNKGKKIDLTFKNSSGGLVSKDESKNIKGFTIAGEDKKFYPAKAVILNKNTIRLYHEEVSHPVSIRYAWADNPGILNLVNKVNLPAVPFRTDSWPGITK